MVAAHLTLVFIMKLCDGIGTTLSSLFGSPFGTVIYIGHPAHKRNGAKVGYSLVNGCIYLIFSWFGILALIQSIGKLIRSMYLVSNQLDCISDEPFVVQ